MEIIRVNDSFPFIAESFFFPEARHAQVMFVDIGEFSLFIEQHDAYRCDCAQCAEHFLALAKGFLRHKTFANVLIQHKLSAQDSVHHKRNAIYLHVYWETASVLSHNGLM